MTPKILFSLMCALAVPAAALEVPFRARPADGGFPGEWLTAFSAGARDAGLANASTALTGGAAAYANPAGIAESQTGEVVMMVAPLLFSGQYQALSVANPISDYSNISVSFLHMGSGVADKTDELGQSIGSFSEQDYAFLLTYAQRATQNLSAGLTVKSVRQSMAGLSATGFGADLGMQAKLFSDLTIGLSALNLVPPKLKLRQDPDTFPLFYKAGAAYQYSMMNRPVLLCADAGTFTPSGGRRLLRGGAAVEIQPLAPGTPFFIRFGVNHREYTVGFSVGAGNFLFDYAAAFHELDTLHRFGMTFRYDVMSASEAKRIKAERLAELKQDARDWLNAGNIEKCEAVVRRILELDETDSDAAAISLEVLQIREKAVLAARLIAAKAEAAAKLSQAKRFYRQKKYSLVLEALEGREDLLKGDARAQGLIAMARAHVLLEKGNYPAALALLQHATELDPDNREALLLYKRTQDIVGVMNPGR